ncbi:hypothetical protein [Niabella aurantiaca]|uniref:hypothetical protein n=1 Tax=Niabella aurantiaca TaxID=379900 RepID=UPI00036DC073|nr:hypothetical protein [Niabella aurantiaca]
MSKKRKRSHTTTKNTVAKPPVTRLAEYTMDVNGVFTLVTDITDPKVFDRLYREWFDHPATFMWCGESLAGYIKYKMPNNFCVMKEEYEAITKGKVIHATREEWEAENN